MVTGIHNAWPGPGLKQNYISPLRPATSPQNVGIQQRTACNRRASSYPAHTQSQTESESEAQTLPWQL